jgi:hypothetical protein
MRELRIIQEKDKLLTLAEVDKVGWPASLLNWSEILHDERVEMYAYNMKCCQIQSCNIE